MYIGENIRYLRIKHGYSQEELAKALGYKSYTTITKWESGVSEPTLKMTNQIATFFKVSVNELCYTRMGFELSNSPKYRQGVVINVLGRVAAGIPINAVEEIIDTEEITEEMARTGEFFGLQIHGDSMEPKISDGDVVIVRQQDDAESGEIVIALVNGDEATCKRLKKYADGIMLISNNPKYEPMVFTEKEIVEKPVKIIGRVVELRAKF
ncbi:MAG: helix-turn-helix domain-containing protein [Lachnospiraceae bacterium]|nr:helix-turn-helix domain-containing protein [Lachnospiraceae bacterium]